MKVAVVGSRGFTDQEYLDSVMDRSLELLGTFTVVSGGAKGADSLVRKWAESRGVGIIEYPADWDNLDHPDALIKTRRDGKKYDARAGFRRNQLIIDELTEEGDSLFAFMDWHNRTRGTVDSINKALAAMRKVLVLHPSHDPVVLLPPFVQKIKDS